MFWCFRLPKPLSHRNWIQWLHDKYENARRFNAKPEYNFKYAPGNCIFKKVVYTFIYVLPMFFVL